MYEFTLTTRNVNNKTILREITELVDDIIKNFNIVTTDDSRPSVILEIIEEHLQDIADSGRISQIDVICDTRNNTRDDIKNGITVMDLEYKQKNCYNVTRLTYRISNRVV